MSARYRQKRAATSSTVGQQALKNLTDGLIGYKQKVQQQQNDLDYYDDKLAQGEGSHPGIFPSKADGKRYDPKIREASYILQGSGVAQAHVGDTLKKITKTLTGQELEQVPSYALQNSITREMRALSVQQVKESLSGSHAATLKFDGTTKRLGHLVEVQATTDSGQTLLLGLRQQPGGTAKEYVDTIKDMCSTVDLSLSDVANTLTDRCVTNSLIHKLLEKLKGGKMNEFKCAMHPLDSMAKHCDKAVREHENEADQPSGTLPFHHRGESLTQATVRVFAKLFHNTKYYQEDLHTYLAQTYGTGTLYYRFVGNRFHVFFLSSGMLFSYVKSINEYFETVQSPRNQLETAVHNALKSKMLLVTLKALGIIGKAVSGPWMRLVGMSVAGRTPRILEMNEHFDGAVKLLKGEVKMY